MYDHIARADKIAGQAFRADERSFGTVLVRNGADLGVVSGHDDLVETPAGYCRFDGIGDNRRSTKRKNIFPRNSFAAPTRRDDTEVHETNTYPTTDARWRSMRMRGDRS